jgi:hypothetical protein
MVCVFSVWLICQVSPGFKAWGLAPGWVVLFFRKKQLASLRQFFLQKSTTHPTPII